MWVSLKPTGRTGADVEVLRQNLCPGDPSFLFSVDWMKATHVTWGISWGSGTDGRPGPHGQGLSSNTQLSARWSRWARWAD